MINQLISATVRFGLTEINRTQSSDVSLPREPGLTSDSDGCAGSMAANCPRDDVYAPKLQAFRFSFDHTARVRSTAEASRTSLPHRIFRNCFSSSNLQQRLEPPLLAPGRKAFRSNRSVPPTSAFFVPVAFLSLSSHSVSPSGGGEGVGNAVASVADVTGAGGGPTRPKS